MSTSLAAAKKRRAPPQNNPPPAPVDSRGASSQIAPSGGMTLPQVIAVVDKRLLILETSMKEVLGAQSSGVDVQNQIPSNITEVLDEFNARFETMALEIENLKNIVLSLQSYTMDVNKMLLEERVRILSDTETDAKVSEV